MGLFSVLIGYFSELRELINRRVPTSIEPADHPRMPFADAAKDLVLKPFQNITNTNMNRSVKKLPPRKKEIALITRPRFTVELFFKQCCSILVLIKHSIKDFSRCRFSNLEPVFDRQSRFSKHELYVV